MPPVAKFTKESIIEKALELVSENGRAALSARTLSERLGCSTSPIFTVYKDMDELKADVYDAAEAYMRDYMAESRDYTPAFRQQGMLLIRFAMEEPHLFNLVYKGWNNEPKDIEELFRENLEKNEETLGWIQSTYGLNKEETLYLYRHLWSYTFAMAALAANMQCSFTEEEIEQGLDSEFTAMLNHIRSGEYRESTVRPGRTDKRKDQ